MRGLVPKLASLAAAIAALLVLAPSALAVPTYSGNFKVSMLGSPNKIVAGPDGNMWVTLSDATNNVARISPSGEVKEFDLENVEDPTGIAVGPEGAMWVTLKEAVAKFSTSTPTKTVVTPIAEIKNPSSIVAANGQMFVATTGGVVHFSPLAPAGAGFFKVENLAPNDIDASGFHNCKSPKAYRLEPGRYRFQVRAFAGGLRDASPAQFGFRVIRVAKK